VSSIPDRLDAVRDVLVTLHKDVHKDNDNAAQTSPHLRETVSAVSAALAAVQRARRHAAAAYTKEERR
jgi:hypothetical protein